MDHDTEQRLRGRLKRARKGGGILFCGAGLSADSISIGDNKPFGAGRNLLTLFNEHLNEDPAPRKLEVAASKLRDKIGDTGLMRLLQDKFTTAQNPAELKDILRFPWQAVYTTNYDDAIEQAATQAGRQCHTFDNTDDPEAIASGLPVIHLHGTAKRWDSRNFQNSCILDSESYRRISHMAHMQKWIRKFVREDLETAEVVIFVGYNAQDRHIMDEIFNKTALRDKIFFINRKTAVPDPDLEWEQKQFGTPLYCGREGLAGEIHDILEQDAPQEPRLVAFERFTPSPPAAEPPAQQDIIDLFIHGRFQPALAARDVQLQKSDFHLLRKSGRQVIDQITKGKRIILLNGYPCDGKTLLAHQIALSLAKTRPVYWLRIQGETLLDEAANILGHAEDPLLVIENVFDLPEERLKTLIAQIGAEPGAALLLTARAVATDASSDEMAILRESPHFSEIVISRLDREEAGALSNLVDQIAGWREFHSLGETARLNFILKTCQASLPHLLLRLLKSEHVRNIYRAELNALSLDTEERNTIILALFVASLGEIPSLGFLSDVMRTDAGRLIDEVNHRRANRPFQLVRRNHDHVETVPSIGAREILRNLFPDDQIIDALVQAVTHLAEIQRNSYEQHLFREMMRFKSISRIVPDPGQVNRFYENCKRHHSFRRMPLFWLQWHMARVDQCDFARAQEALEQGYTCARSIEEREGWAYDRRQLDDRKAKFLMIRARHAGRSGGALFRDFRDAHDLTMRLLRPENPKHYPFLTLEEMLRTFEQRGQSLAPEQVPIVRSWFDDLLRLAATRLGTMPPGKQRNDAEKALNTVRHCLARTEPG